MKKIINFGITGLAALLIIMNVSCEKNAGPPTISFLEAEGFVSVDTMLMVGDTITVGVILESNGTNRLESLDVLVSDQIVSSYTLDMERGEYSFNLMKGASSQEVWEFVLRDTKGNETSKKITLSKDPNSIYGGILSFQSIKLGAQGNPVTPGFLSLEGPTLYDINSAFLHQANIDLIYYFDETDQNVLASPGANIPEGVFTGDHTFDTWTTIITTRFIKTDYNAEEFDNFFHDGFFLEAYDEDAAKRKAKELEPGDVYIFKTEAGRFGAFCVRILGGTIDGDLEISLLIQE